MTLQDQYKLILEGKGNKEQFLIQARKLFPGYIAHNTDYNSAITILKGKMILNEESTSSQSKKDWTKIFENNMINEALLDSMIDKIMANLTSSTKENIVSKYKQTIKKGINRAKLDEKEYYKDLLNQIKSEDTNALQSIFNKVQNISEAKKQPEEISKEVKDDLAHNFDNKNLKNIDNLYGTSFLTGFYAEMQKPENKKKTVDEVKSIVAKNMAKDRNYYSKNDLHGVPGLKGEQIEAPKEPKGKYKSSGNNEDNSKSEIVKNSIINAKSTSKTTGLKAPLNENKEKYEVVMLGGTIGENPKPKEFNSKEEAQEYAKKRNKGLTPGEKSYYKIKYVVRKQKPIKEGYMGNKGDKVMISLSGSKTNPTYVLEKPDGSAQIEMFFSSPEEAKKYADKKELIVIKESREQYLKNTVKKLFENHEFKYLDYFDDLEDAKKEAEERSNSEGVVQHVNELPDGTYEISDWYDADTTVASYEGGMPLEENSLNEGNSIGDKVYFRGETYGEKYPSSEGYYGIIQDYDVARNYNMNATYYVDVYNRDGNKLGRVVGDWSNFTDKSPINESKKNKSIDKLLKNVGKVSEELALEAKIEALTMEIQKRKDKVTMAETVDELKEFVNPAKIKEIQKEIKVLEQHKAKCEKLYEKMTGSKKKEVIEEPMETESVEETNLNENKKYDFQKIDDMWEKWAEEEISEEELVDELSKFFNISKEDAEIIRERLVDMGDEIGDESMSFINDSEYQKELFDGINFLKETNLNESRIQYLKKVANKIFE